MLVPHILSLLIVDDNPVDRETYTRFLLEDTGHDFDIHEAATLVEAELSVSQMNFDIVILDYCLPDGSGLELLDYLDKNSAGASSATVIMLTGQGDEEVAAEALRAGISDYIVKGKVTAQVLIHAVEAALSRARLKIQLNNQNVELQSVASTMAHDIRAPLATTRKFSEILKRSAQSKLNDKELRILDHIIAGHVRMDRLMVDMIEYSRMDVSKVPTHAISLSEVVESVLLDIESAIEDSGASISIEPLPNAVGEKHHFKSLFLNLISNAIKFFTDASPDIRIFAEAHGDWTTICVEDNGIGLDSRHADRIFEMFQRLHTEAEYEGTGIGLAICKKIVGHWGGRIWVDAALGEGCRFYFTVQPENESARLPAPRVRPTRQQPIRVAIDQDPGVKKLTRKSDSISLCGIEFVDLRVEHLAGLCEYIHHSRAA